jgi:hypothetical protein
MFILFALSPSLIVIGPVMLALCFAARHFAQARDLRIAFGRLGRVAMVMTVLGVAPMASVMVQSGGVPASFQQALSDEAFGAMGSTILR